MGLLDELKKYFALKGDTLKKDEIIELVGNVSSKPKALSPSDPVPTEAGIYVPTVNGTYPGGIEVDLSEGYTQLIFSGDDWMKVVTPIDNPSLLNDISVKNIYNPYTIISGKYLDPTTYAEFNGSAYSLSDYIPCFASTQYVISGYYPAHYAIPVAFYNSSKVLLSGSTAVGYSATSGGFTTPSGCAFVRITGKTAHPSDNFDPLNVQLEMGSSITQFEPFTNILGFDDFLIFAIKALTKPTDDLSPVNVKYFKNNIATFQNTQFGKNKFDAASVQNGYYIDVTTGATTPNATYSLSPFIPVIGGKTYSVSGFGDTHYGIGVAFYNSAQSLISNTVAGIVTQFLIYATMKDVAYIRFTVKTGHPSDNTHAANIQVEEGFEYTDYEYYKTAIHTINNTDLAIFKTEVKTKGKHMALFGDSITDTSLYNYLTPLNYPFYLANKLECTFDNFALSGASFTDWAYTTGERQRLSKQVQDAVLSGVIPDIVLVSIGTNDYLRESFLGDYDTALTKAIVDLDRTLILEAARWAFYTLSSSFPSAKFFYATPLQRVSTPNGTENNNNGEWLRDSITRLAERYNFTIIDQYSKSGVVKDFEVLDGNGRYLKDGLHTNQDGKELQGLFVANEILNAFS